MSSIDSDRPFQLPAYPLLDGHKRRKKKLVPALNELPVSFVNTLDSIVPEVLWIGGAIEVLGLREAIEIVAEFIRSLSLKKFDQQPEFFRLSVLSNPDYREHVIAGSGFGVLDKVFANFSAFYGAEWSPQSTKSVEYVDAAKTIEEWMTNYSNRFEQPFLLVGGILIYSLAVSDRMKFAPGTMPDLNAFDVTP